MPHHKTATRKTDVPAMPSPRERKTAVVGDDFFTITPVLDAEHGAFQHIVRRSRTTRKATPITFGKMDVKEILLVDPTQA
jgi:hypothetical protein